MTHLYQSNRLKYLLLCSLSLCLGTAQFSLAQAQSKTESQLMASQDDQESSRHSWKHAGMASGLVGLALLSGATAYYSASTSDKNALASSDLQGAEFAQQRSHLKERSEERSGRARVLLGVGGWALIGGILLYTLGGKDRVTGATQSAWNIGPMPNSSTHDAKGLAFDMTF